jgi:RND superfamily putative drug exporter
MLTRLGSWSARRRRLVMTAWAVLFIVGILLGSRVFGYLKDSNGGSGSESVQGFNLVKDARSSGNSMIALVDGASVNDPATRTAVLAAKDELSTVKDVTGVVTAYDVPDARLRATDGRASIMLISVRDVSDMAMHRQVDDVRAALKDAVPGATVKVGGDAAVSRDGMAAMSRDLLMGELIALPLLLLGLVWVFRGIRVALVPLASALVTVAGALLLLLGMTQLMDVGNYAVDVVVLFGLALAVDYSLLMTNRFREERAAHGDAGVTVLAGRTTAAAGRTITFSALTVMAALAGFFAFGNPTFSSLAIGGIATVFIALVAGLTLTPALLASFAKHVGTAKRAQADDGFFGRLARGVQRRPLIVAVLTAGVLAALAIPFLHANFGNGDPRTLPRNAESRQVAARLLADFPASRSDPVMVVGRVPSSDPRVQEYVHRISSLPGVAGVTVESGLRGNLSAIDVVPAGSVQSDVAQGLVSTLRDQRPNYPSYVTGQAAFLVDFKHQITSRLPYAFGLIALATFILLFLMTGSVLVPVKALLMNTLSLGATFGSLVWVFQEGHLSSLLGFDAFGAIELWVPIVVFVFAFGLSMDYEVFLLSRIKECYDECGNSNNAVANGLQRSGRIITSAAALVVLVFLGFAAGQSIGIKEMGLSLAIAVVVDATLVRCLLVPATMTLLGNANWWAPAPLRRLYDRFGLREAPQRPVPADVPPIPAQPLITTLGLGDGHTSSQDAHILERSQS